MNLPDELTTELIRIADNIEDTVENVITDSATNETFTTAVGNNLVFYGRSLILWDDELSIPLPEEGDLTPEVIRAIYVKLGNNLQIANHWYSQSAAANSVSSASIEIKKADLITALVSHYHSTGAKPPPGAVLDRMADSYTKRLANLTNTSKIIRNFWKDKLTMLESLRGIIKDIAISSAVELKHQSGDF